MGIRSIYSFLFLYFYFGIYIKDANSQWLDALPGSKRNCQATKELRSATGEYNFIKDIYRYHDFCLYIIPDDGAALTISFLDFNFGFEDKNRNCTSFVEITSFEGTPEPQRERYCGSQNPPTYITPHGYAMIWVHKEYIEPNMNLLMHYSTAPKCHGNVEITSYTFITSPSFPSFAPPGTHCDWSISLHAIAKNYQLQFQLSSWKVAGVGARLELYSGIEKSFVASFDATTSSDFARSKIFVIDGPQLYIAFYSGSQRQAGFNATVKVKGYCIPGTYPCGDGLNCYSQNQLCDSRQDCSTGYDELGCGACVPTQFWCGKDDDNCYFIDERCNANKDCTRSMADEANCKTCGPGSFLCKSENKCIYESWRCDNDNDCSDRSDEEDCSYAASRRVITAAVIGSLICSLLLVIALGCTCKLYSLRASHHRHPHSQYRATPLTRVEQELFQRQAPPTYDMMVSGAPTEAAANPRVQRQRRRRNRRYQFQRAAPANIGHQTNRAEGAVSDNTQATTTVIPTQTNEQNTNNSTSIVVESVPELLAEMMFGVPRPSTSNMSSSSVPVRASTPLPILKDSGTQTGLNSNNENPSSIVSQPSSSISPSSSSNSRRSTRSSSAGRSRRSTRGSPNSKDQQAKPLPKKKRILPVMVPAPLADSVVEEDTLACVYPCPPSYSQAVASDDPKIDENVAETSHDADSLSSIAIENQDLSPEPVFSPDDEDLTTTKSSFFSFSIAQTLRNIAASSFSKFQKNPYTQMTTQINANGSVNEELQNITSANNGSQSFVLRHQLRPSTSSDESILDCTLDNDSLGLNNELQDMTQKNLITQSTTSDINTQAMTSDNITQDMASGNTNVKVFPQRKAVNAFNSNEISPRNDNSLDMSDF